MEQKKQKAVAFARWPKENEVPWYEAQVKWMASVERAVVINRRLAVFAVVFLLTLDVLAMVKVFG